MKYFLSAVALLCAISSVSAQGHGASFAPVAVPSLPYALSFAGERVPLENFDTKESLRRELLVTSYMHSRTMLTLLNTKRYFAIIEPVLERNGIPADFKYLCMAESALDPNAVSSAKAGGLWQFMPATGKEFGLEVGTEIDERFHIEKATQAACEYLRKSYEKFGSWTLAAAAYNLGEAGVERRITRQQVTDYYDSFFPAETMRYIFRILSFKLLVENPAAYGYEIRWDQYYPAYANYKEIGVNDKDIDWSVFAANNGTTYKMLRELNPWIRDYQFANKAGKTYTVKIPEPGFRTSGTR